VSVLYAAGPRSPRRLPSTELGISACLYHGKTPVPAGRSPILNLERRSSIRHPQAATTCLLKRLNAHKRFALSADNRCQARLNSYELAYRMESAAPDAVKFLSKETEATKAVVWH